MTPTARKLDAEAEMAWDDGLSEEAHALRKFEKEHPLHAIAAIIEEMNRTDGDPLSALDEIARVVLGAIVTEAVAKAQG